MDFYTTMEFVDQFKRLNAVLKEFEVKDHREQPLMSKADIDFEKELWDAANELRGAVSENNYKNYILPLVFVKRLSER